MDNRAFRNGSLALGPFVLLAASLVTADDTPKSRTETLFPPNGPPIPGRIVTAAASGFEFQPTGAAPALRLAPGTTMTFEGPGPDPSSGVPPFRVELGLGQRLSGKLGSMTAAAVQLLDAAGGGPILLARAGVLAVIQHPGEALVFQEAFEALDPARWTVSGGAALVTEPRATGSSRLKLPAGAASATCRLSEPVGSGRIEVAFLDDKTVAPGQLWTVALTFRGTTGPESVRAVLGWSEESLAVESTGGPALAVQRLTRRAGWHRLSIRFGPEQTEVAVDGNELAHGKGPGGPLIGLQLATATTGKNTPPPGLAGHVDDLRLVRFAEPTGGFEIDPTQDEVRLVSGDQVFGTVRTADAERVVVSILGKDVAYSWSEVSGLYFRRSAAQGDPIEGLLVRLEWRSAPGNDPGDLDQVEGALTAVTEASLSVATPYAGVLAIPRERLKRLRVLGAGRRLVIDPTAHHLGNEISSLPPLLDPPQPEGGVLERSFTIDKVPPGPAFLILDVVQVVGEAPGLPFTTELRNGALRTNVTLNGKPIDYLNRHIASKNEAPERIRLAVPAGLLHPGKNQLRLEQTGREGDPNEFDDLGVLGIAVEFDPARPLSPTPAPRPEKP